MAARRAADAAGATAKVSPAARPRNLRLIRRPLRRSLNGTVVFVETNGATVNILAVPAGNPTYEREALGAMSRQEPDRRHG
jgi:hypothetical protein